MKKVVVVILAVIGALALAALFFAAVIAIFVGLGRESVPGRIVLEWNAEGGVVESVPDDPFAQLMLEDTLELRDVVDALDRAADDRRVQGLVVRIGGSPMGLAHLQEVRDAVLRFRAAGKPAWAWAETFGEFGPGNGGYYLATAFDRVYLQPSGDVGLTGLAYETPFVRDLLEKLGVTPRLSQRYEFKNAMNTYTERGYTEAHRTAMEALMRSQFGQLVRGVAEARGLSEERVVELFDEGPYLGQEALDTGLVDALGYRDEVFAAFEELVDERAKNVSLGSYLERVGRPHRRGTTLALVHGYGAVVRGKSSFSPIDGSVRMGSDTVTEALGDAIDDDRVDAIVFRVDSPGGSYVASDTIRREIVRAREADKPVVVSMGNLAGSGGYFVAMDADRIVAQPGTITASIGVFGGKLLTRGFWDKIGVSWDDVHTGSHSLMYSARHDYGEAEERFHASLDRIYDDFTRKVAAGRDLPLERVLDVARGRIWTGEDALRLGLVDALGGLDAAYAQTRELLELESDAPIRVKRFPRRRTPLELLLQRAESGRSVAVAAARALAEVQPVVRRLGRLGLAVGEDGVLTMPDPGLARP